MRIHWIWLAHRPKVSDRLKAALLARFQDAEEVYFAQEDTLAQIEELTPEAKDALADKSLEDAQAIMERCRETGLQILTLGERDYPLRLKNIPDPPLVLYFKGRLPDFDGNPVIGVVGTRKASAYGLSAANRMGYQIAACGGLVVSGLASGIDAMAMEGALLAGKPTVGVLGCGADVIYPKSNRQLFRSVEEYGCILSEFPPGTPGFKGNFPKRNRIISGLSNGVLVVEAPEKSGALITANAALEQGRDVFVVPGNIDQTGFVGSNRLLREGAAAVSSGWDILCEYEGLFPGKIRRNLSAPESLDSGKFQEKQPAQREKTRLKVAQKPERPEKKPNSPETIQKIAIDKAASGSYSDVNDAYAKLSEDERKIVSALAEGERLVDEVIAQTQLTTGRLLAMLTMLELKGIVRRLPGKRITLVRRDSGERNPVRK